MFKNNLVVVVKCDGKILREQGETIYMPYRKEYSLLIKNLFSRKVSVGIEIDGQDVLNGKKLIIDANSELELERYLKDLDKGNKFRFIEMTEDIENYRGKKVADGLIRVSFQYEKIYNWNWTPGWWGTTIYQPTYVEYPTLKKFEQYPQTTWIYSGGSTCSSGSFITQCIQSANLNNNINCSLNSFNDNGITVPGSISEQKFQHGYIGELESEVHVITLQLKGKKENYEVKQPLTVDRKLMCVTCGKSNKSSSKFCSNCGTSLEII